MYRKSKNTLSACGFIFAESLLFVFDSSIDNDERALFLCPKSSLSQLGGDERDHSRRVAWMKTTRGITGARETDDRKEGAEETLRTFNFFIPPLGSCPRKTVLGLSCPPLLIPRLTMRARVDQLEGCARNTW